MKVYEQIYFALIVFLVGVAAIAIQFRNHLFIQKVKNTPTSKVSAVALGLVELSGTAEFSEQMVSPISKVPCVYWKINASYHTRGTHGTWKQFYTSESFSAFYLKDETGKILISPAGARIYLTADKEFRGTISGDILFSISSKTKLSNEAMGYINSLDEKRKNLFYKYGKGSLSIEEYYIANNDHLYIIGNAEQIEGASSSIGCENLVIKKGKSDKTMFISDKSEKLVLQSHSSLWRVIIGAVCSIIGLIMILMIFNVK